VIARSVRHSLPLSHSRSWRGVVGWHRIPGCQNHTHRAARTSGRGVRVGGPIRSRHQTGEGIGKHWLRAQPHGLWKCQSVKGRYPRAEPRWRNGGRIRRQTRCHRDRVARGRRPWTNERHGMPQEDVCIGAVGRSARDLPDTARCGLSKHAVHLGTARSIASSNRFSSLPRG
jgi:hypothetical protein